MYYQSLGRSGLLVSPLALGTMTFGANAWGSDEATSQRVFDAYAEAGGNFVDTADVYSGGTSEEWVGKFVKARGLRDRMVIATKCGFHTRQAQNPNAGGNGRKHVIASVEASLRRLGTDYVDLYWMHVYDGITPVEETLQVMGDLVRAGKIRYFGLSDGPAWAAAKTAALAKVSGVPGPIALQPEYSLVERNVEREHVPAALDAGLGIVPWSPLAGGFLSGKYGRGKAPYDTGGGRLSKPNPFGTFKFTERNYDILDVLLEVAKELDQSAATVAVTWLTQRPAVTSILVGARTEAQLAGNLDALDIQLSPKQIERLDAASALPMDYSSMMGSKMLRGAVFGGLNVR